MSFYKYFLCMIFTISNLQKTTVGNKELVIKKQGIKTIVPSSAGLVFFVDVNNTSTDDDYEVELTPDECCIDVGDNSDCNVIEIIGDCVSTVSRGTTKTLELVAPLIDPYERTGYCTVYLNSKPKNRQRGTMRNPIKMHITVNTRFKNSKQSMEIPENVTACQTTDEDPFNDCKPVNCEIYYNGKRSYFDERNKRCLRVPRCVSDKDEEIPNAIYDHTRNKCTVGNSITDSDIKFIKDLTGVKSRNAKDILIVRTIPKNHAKKSKQQNSTMNKTSEVKTSSKDKNKTPIKTSSETSKKPSNKVINKAINNIRNQAKKIFKGKDYKIQLDTKKLSNKISQLDLMDYKLERDKNKIEMVKKTGKKFLSPQFILENKWTFLVFGSIILVQCFFMCTMALCLTNKCSSTKKQKVVRKFFNYRQDVSVTTPLIRTSNINTETTDFQYLSDSSNMKMKTKCYNTCQKERKHNMKMSMSDGILSKCLTRRDWNSKPAQSNAIPEINLEEYRRDDILEAVSPKSTVAANASVQTKEASDTKVNFENEKPSKPIKEKKQSKIIKSIVKKIESRNNKRDSKNFDQLSYKLSEKEIKCHSYNNDVESANITGFKPSSDSKRTGFFQTKKSKKGTTISTEKGTQASFSNDSIDDYLSERGLIFLANENLSKYSFSSHSNDAKSSSSSEISSKTSKNNVVKNIIKLMHKKSSPSSDPGVQADSDLKVIHMSNVSLNSSNRSSDILVYKNSNVPKDSRSSL